MTGTPVAIEPGPALPLAEQFGPTLQGEGPAAGRLAHFVRLGGCNLSCSWCDTPYTWDRTRYDLRKEITRTPVEAILERIPAEALVVITGGEPLLQQRNVAWAVLLRQLERQGCQVHVETNGTIPPDHLTAHRVQLYVVSPKLANAGEHRPHQAPELHPAWGHLARAGHAVLKVVCGDAADVDRAVQLAEAYGWPLHKVWVMPQGTTPAALAATWPAVATAAAGHGINASHRLHVLAWGDERGH